MSPQIAQAALQFLARTELRGAEVDAFLAVVQALKVLANPQPLPEPVARTVVPHRMTATL